MRKFLIPLITISLLLGVGIPAYAQGQTAASVIVYNVDTSTFPTITGFVDVIDSNGIFASGLKPEAVSIIENGQPLPADAFTELAIPHGNHFHFGHMTPELIARLRVAWEDDADL